MTKTENQSDVKISHIIDLAWADDVSFDSIEKKLGVSEKDVILIMRSNLKLRSFKVWRERVAGRKSKHTKLLRTSDKKQLRENLAETKGQN
jgi:uncharacterized protein (TIGR03643 family)